MDIRQLRTFVEVAKLKSFSKAAEKLFMTQPSVSNHVQAMEKEYDAILFNRLGKEVSLTEAGLILYAKALDIINIYESIKFEISNYQGVIDGHLEILSSSVPRKQLLPGVLHDFSKDYPHVSFTILDLDSDAVVQRILSGESDFGIVGSRIDKPNLEYEKLLEDSLVLITPNSFREELDKKNTSSKNTNRRIDSIMSQEGKKPNTNILCDIDLLREISLSDIKDQTFIFREEGSGTREAIRKALEEIGININELKTFAYVEDTEAIKKMVSLGSGCSFISCLEVDSLNDDKYSVFTVKELRLKRDFYLVSHKARQLSPLGEKFKEFITQVYKG